MIKWRPKRWFILQLCNRWILAHLLATDVILVFNPTGPILIQKVAKFIHRWPCSASSWSAILNWTSLCPVHIFKRLCSKVLVAFTWMVSQTDILIVIVVSSQYLFLIFCVIFPSKIIFHVRCLTYSSQES